MSDVRFTFGGDPTDASRASERVESKLEQLQRQALQTSAALKTIGDGPRSSLGRFRREARDTSRDVDVLDGGFRGLIGTMSRVNISFRFFGNIMALVKFPAIIAAVGLLVQAVSALAAGLVAVSGALGPVSGLLLAMPGALSAVLQGVVSLTLAFSGLDDALKAQKEGVSAVEAAQLGLRASLVNQKEALKDSGRRSLEYAQASLDVVKAQKSLKEAQEGTNPALEKFAALIDNRLEPAMMKLRRSAAEGLFPGLTRGIKAASGNLPRLEKVVGRTAGTVGVGAQGLGQLVGEQAFGRDFARIGGTNVRVLASLGAAMTSLTSAVRHLMVAGGPFLVWIARGVADFAAWTERVTFAGRESGKLAAFFERSQESLRLLWGVLRPFGSALLNIFSAAAPLGREVMEALGGAAENFDAWTESAEGQNRLRRYFEDVKPALFETGRLLRDMTNTFFRLGADPGFNEFLRKVRVDLLPTIERLVRETTSNFGPALTDALVAIADLITALAGSSGPLVLFVEAIGGMARFFTQIIEGAPIIRQTLFSLVGVAATLAAVRFTAMITGLSAVLGLMRGVSGFQTTAAATPGFLPGIAAGAQRGRAAPGTVPVGVPVAPAVRPGRFARFGAPAAGVGGFAAVGAGGAIGGVAGAALGGAGIGAAIGSTVAPVAGTIVGAGLGAGAGALLGFLAQKGGGGAAKVDSLTQALNQLGQAFRTAATAGNTLGVAQEAVGDSALNLEAAEVQVDRAERNLGAVRRQFGKDSLEYREALVGLRIAEENRRDAVVSSRSAEEEQRKARENNRIATTELWREIDKEGGALRRGIAAAGEWRNVREENSRTTRRVWVPDLERQRELVGDFRDRMSKLAGVMQKENRPALRNVALAAERLATRLGEIPTDVQIKAEIDFFARFQDITLVETNRQFGGGPARAPRTRRHGPPGRDGPGEPTGNWVKDSANRATLLGAREFIERNRNAILARVRPQGGQGGDIVGVGRWLQTLGYLVGEHPAFGGVSAGHVRNSLHFAGRAIDVNWPNASAEPGFLDRIFPMLAAMHPAELLWRTAGHFDHLHVGFKRGGRALSALGRGKGKDSIPAMLTPGEFVVTPGGERMLEGMTFPGVLNWLGRNQPAAFQEGGRATRRDAREERRERRERQEQRISRRLERRQRAGDILALRLSRMETRQELSGLETSPGELLRQASFLRRRVIPQERAELRGLRRARRQALETGNKELARELKREIFAQMLAIDQLKLDAAQRTAEATEATRDAMKEFGGGIGVQFGGSLFSDRILGSLVGA